MTALCSHLMQLLAPAMFQKESYMSTICTSLECTGSLDVPRPYEKRPGNEAAECILCFCRAMSIIARDDDLLLTVTDVCLFGCTSE